MLRREVDRQWITCMQEDQGNRLPAEAMHMQALLSFDSQKRNNIHLLDTNIVLTSAGTNVILLDTTTCKPQYLPIPVSGGIGALAASDDHRYCSMHHMSSCPTMLCHLAKLSPVCTWHVKITSDVPFELYVCMYVLLFVVLGTN